MKIKLKLKMEKKSYLIMVMIFFLVLLVNIVYAGIWDDFLNLFSDEKKLDDVVNDDVFKELILNDASKTEAIMLIKNPVESINIQRDDIKINFNEVCGSVNSYKLLINSTCEAERVKEYIYDINEVCYNMTEIEEICKLNCSNSSVEEICINETSIKGIIYEHYYYDCFKEFNQIDATDLRDIKIKADVKWNKCSDGTYGYKIDWQPEIKLSDGTAEKILINDKWAWWNETYAYKMEINCTNLDDYIPIVINGSDGFTLNGNKQIVWSYCSGNGTALYYDDYINYAVANDTGLIPFEVEFGNGTSYNPASVWDSDYKMVQHMNNYNTTHISDSTSNTNLGAKSGTIETEGMIGKAQFFNGSEYITVLDSASLTLSADMTLEAWMNTTALADYILQKGVFNEDGYIFQFYTDNAITFYTLQSGAWQRTRTTTPYVTVNVIHHLVITMTSGTARVFIDMVETGYTQQDTHTAPTDGATELVIGSTSAKDDGFFNGIMDELRLSNTGRSVSFLNQTYQNKIGTFGYGDLGIVETAPPPPSYTLNGTVKDSDNILVNNATIIIINQVTNTIIGKTNSNSTGGWNYTVDIGIYLVVAYDPNNSTRDGDADPYIVVS